VRSAAEEVCDLNAVVLPRKERQLLEAVTRGGRLLTRIKELGDCDLEFIQFASSNALRADLDVHDGLGMEDDDIITCLHALEGRGLLASNLTVYNTSTTEYICEWTPRDGR